MINEELVWLYNHYKKVARGLKYSKVEQFWSFLIAEFWGVKGQDLTSIHFWFFQLLWSPLNIHFIGYCRGKLYDNHLLGENVHNMNRIQNPDALSSFLDYSRDFSFVHFEVNRLLSIHFSKEELSNKSPSLYCNRKNVTRPHWVEGVNISFFNFILFFVLCGCCGFVLCHFLFLSW